MFTQLKLILISLRPHQWVKNTFVFAALIFSLNLFNWSLVKLSLLAFIVFCLLSGGIYLINDWLDLSEDRQHPLKSQRPLASGRLSLPLAVTAAVILLGLGLFLSLLINSDFFVLALAYVVLQTLYSIKLRGALLADILTVSIGFVLRAWAGAAAIQVMLSPWLLACSFFLALMLVLGKRFVEPRKYPPQFLEKLVVISAATAIITYTIYSVLSPVGQGQLIFTLPFVVYGVFRYLYLVYYGQKTRPPTESLVTDAPLILSVAIWVALIVILIYN